MSTRFKRFFTTLAAFATTTALLASPASADDALKYSWTKGQTVNYRTTTDANVDMTLPQGPMKQTVNMVMGMSLTVKEIGEDGAATLEAKYTLAKMDMDAPMMGKLSFDSSVKEQDPSNPLAGMSSMIDKPFTMVVESNGKVRELKGLAELMGDMGAMGQMFNDETMKANLEQAFYILPDKPAAKGDSWTRTSVQDPLKLENTFTLKSSSGNSAEIDVATKFGLNSDEVMGMKVELQEGKGSGTITFDNGQVKSSVGTSNFTIKLITPQGEMIQKAVTKTTIEKVD